MAEKYTLTFENVESYDKYKDQIKQAGGKVENDFGTVLLGFTASMPPTLAQSIQSSRSLVGDGITTFDRDSVVTTQAGAQ